MKIKRRWAVCAALLGITAANPSCTDTPTDVTTTVESAVPDLAQRQRAELSGGIAHYTFDLSAGLEPYGTVRLHRLVKEERANHPVKTRDAIFLLTGGGNTFEEIYLEPAISSAIPPDQSIAVFLAENGMDVWGMDFAWALIPESVTDFGFMQDWGMDRDVHDVQKALSVTRWLRVATGQGNGRLHLLGFCSSVGVAFAIAGQEALEPEGRRDVKALIAVDALPKYADPGIRESDGCGSTDAYQALLDAGQYQTDDGVFLKMLAELATSAPDDASPIVPGFTNLQFALYVGMNHDAGYHFVGGFADPASGMPSGLRFTDQTLWLDIMKTAAPYVPARMLRDFNALLCDRTDVPWDDHLSDIDLPILLVGAAGGLGPYLDANGLTSSADVTQIMVQALSDAEHAYDMGHADVFSASNAETVVWQPILNWLLAHHSNTGRSGNRKP